MTFKPSSYLSTSGSYNDEEQYKAQKDDIDGKELECRSQRDESNRSEVNRLLMSDVVFSRCLFLKSTCSELVYYSLW